MGIDSSLLIFSKDGLNVADVGITETSINCSCYGVRGIDTQRRKMR